MTTENQRLSPDDWLSNPPDRDIIVIANSGLNSDLLYDIREELSESGSDTLSSRIEIERRHHVSFHESGYQPMFTLEELFNIGLTLLAVKLGHEFDDTPERVERIKEFGQILADSIDDGYWIDTETVPGFSNSGCVDLFEALAGNEDIELSEDAIASLTQS